ncbi:MAG: HAD family hydrolase [Anaerostipes sp.]|nr:HAD family hydrolase [Anaerostipes sp.]
MGKLLFFDADETAFSNKTNSVPESAKKAFRLAKENGHQIFLNTGRPLGYRGHELDSIDFDGFLCSNGNCIVYHDDLLFHNMIPSSICQQIIPLIPKHDIRAVLETKDCSYLFDQDDTFHPYLGNVIHAYQEDDTIPAQYSYGGLSQFEKFICFSRNPCQMDAFLRDLKALPYSFTYIKNSDTFYEVIPADFHKVTAIKHLATHLNQPLDDCYAFGDSPNDVSMFQTAGHSILMGNGYKELKSLVEYITTDIDEDGIYNAMKHYHFI